MKQKFKYYFLFILKEEIEQAKVAYKKVNSVKEGLDKEILTLREASKNSNEEVKRLSGSVSSKDVELDRYGFT